MREIVDIFLFNNEIEVLDLRVKILEDVVDKFIVREATHTFQGEPKECLASTYKHPKVFVSTIETPTALDTWERERFQRSFKINFEEFGIKENSIILTSDLDEIPDPKALLWLRDNFNSDAIYAFEQKMYQYYLNVRNLSEEWSGSRACSTETYLKYDAEFLRQRKDLCLTILDAGWHWSFLGGEEQIEKKIASYSHEEYDNEEVIKQIAKRMLNNEDVFGRGFTLQTVPLDDSYPSYILENQDKLSHLIRKYQHE
jgi:beta-1,4-mannosyl-glycoprotein beta-1,4-N-acetylglucosaminyltransferase